MNARRVSEIEALLEGVPLPASRELLVRYAYAEDPDAAAVLRNRLVDREYVSLNEVGEALRGVVRPPRPSASLPVPESGSPPGGDAYVKRSPQPGAVEEQEPPSDVLERQATTQKKQKAKQQS